MTSGKLVNKSSSTLGPFLHPYVARLGAAAAHTDGARDDDLAGQRRGTATQQRAEPSCGVTAAGARPPWPSPERSAAVLAVQGARGRRAGR